MNQKDDNTRTVVVLTKGTVVHQYKIIEKIGAGGMGEVYLAEDTKLKRNIALKFLPTQFLNNDDIKKRFQREAQAVAKLNHPNIVTIHEVSEFNGRPFFVMENIDGHSLRYFIKEKPQPADAIIEFALQICQGLGEAHRHGITHRDIKPANIALDRTNRIRLLDFGLAATEGDDKLTKTGSTLGTVSYMSPEQISGRDIDHRSDLFSLGIVLYELLCGRTPFKRDNEGATLKAIIESNPEPINRYKSDVPDKLQDIILKLIEKDKELRYQSAEGVIADLKRLMYDSQSHTYPSGRTHETSFKNLYFKMSAVAVFLIIVIGFMYFYNQPEQIVNKPPVLIVLPFENLGAGEDEYFSDGIRDEISSRLSTVKGLRVISPRTADKFKETDKSIEQIGQETNSDYVLEATIRWDKSGEVDRIRITPRLTKTSDNYLMWSDIYEQQLVQIFDVQSKIAEQIVIALGLTLVETDKLAPDYAPTTNMAAYNFYLRGLEISSHNLRMSDFQGSINMFDSAIALDSNFALAWAQKSMNHSTFNFHFTSVNGKYHKNEALKAAEKALALDPTLPTAQIAMGTYSNYIERDYEKALSSFNRAKSELTSNAELSQAIGIVKMRQGKWDEANEKFEEAIRIDPLSDRRYFYIANSLSMTRNYEEADNYINRALVLDPNNADAAYLKVLINLLRYGNIEYDVEEFKTLYEKVGLAEISTYELTSGTSLGLWRYIPDLYDPQIEIENIRKLSNIKGTIAERSPHIIQMNIGHLYELSGHHDSALIYYDSSRIILTNIIDQGEPEFHAFAELGLTYALMGNKEEAIKAGKTSKELMSVDDCHW